MTTLHDIQRHLVERIGTAPVGSTLRFRLMDAADAVSLALVAEAKSRGAETYDLEPSTTPETSTDGPEAVAPNFEDTDR